MTLIWLIWLGIFVPLEIYGLWTNRRGDTLSENVWMWFHVMDKRPTVLTWILRAVLLVFLGWLTMHLVFGWWTIWEMPSWLH
jgi:hypothetical protein